MIKKERERKRKEERRKEKRKERKKSKRRSLGAELKIRNSLEGEPQHHTRLPHS